MSTKIRYVGLDVHKETVVVAVAEGRGGPVEVVATVPNTGYAVRRALDNLGMPKQLRVCYEAGPTGFGLARDLRDAGYHCIVVAPSLIPKQAGQRIKTDRRDAVKLARFLRSGDLTEVTIPEEQTEAMRDLERAREDAMQSLQRVRQQLDKFLLRHGRQYTSGRKKWTLKHHQWLKEQVFSEESQRRTLDSYLRRIEQNEEELKQVTQDVEELVETWALAPLVKSLQAMRGVGLISAVTLVAEIGDFDRFRHPRQLMAYLGLIPSERSSGQSRRQGGITRTGNRQARRILVESAWSYRHRAQFSREMRARQKGLSDEIKQIAAQAQRRLCRRYRRLSERGKPRPQVVTAIARELAGFVWAVAKCSGQSRSDAPQPQLVTAR